MVLNPFGDGTFLQSSFVQSQNINPKRVKKEIRPIFSGYEPSRDLYRKRFESIRLRKGIELAQKPIPSTITEIDAKARARYVHPLISLVGKAKSAKVFEKQVLTY